MESRMSVSRAWGAWLMWGALLMGSVTLTAACGEEPVGGCVSDDECKGDRVCVAGACAASDDPNNSPNNTPNNAPNNSPADVGVEDVEELEDASPVDAATDAPQPGDVSLEDVEGDVPSDDDAEGDVFDAGDDASPEDEEAFEDVPEPLGPVVEVTPDALDFGEVGLRLSAASSLTIANTGESPLTVQSVALEVSPSSSFEIVSPRPTPLIVQPGQESVFEVRFQPSAVRGDQPTPLGNAALIRTDDPERPVVSVPLEGVAVPNPPYCLVFEERTVDFGFVAPGDVESAQMTLSNCGVEPITVTQIGVEGQAEDISVAFGPTLPVLLEPEEDFTVVLTYAPTEVRVVRGQLVADIAEDTSRASVTLLGEPVCPSAVARARLGEGEFNEEGLVATTGQAITLDGALSVDPGPLTYAWTLEAPDGSQTLTVEPGLDAERLTFVPDVPGIYRAVLQVRSDLSGLEACQEAQLRFDVAPATPAVRLDMTWDNGADLDLHLVRSVEGEFGPFGNQTVQENDCYYANLTPDWGAPGARFDDPRLLGDDTDGEGPETTLIPVLEADRRYRVALHYARRLNTERVEATLTLTLAGQEPREFTTTMEDQGTFWVPVVIEGDGTLTEVDTFLP